MLKDKSVVITGGTGALGQIVASTFLREGCSVAASYLSEDAKEHLAKEFRERVELIRADVTDGEQVAILFQKSIAKFRKIDILINLAGGFVPKSPIRDVTTRDWDAMMNINLRSAFLCSREFLRRLGEATYGRIVSIAAMPVFRPAAGRGPYAVSKAGVVMLTQILGEELRGTGITANAIAPSILRTEANVASMPSEDVSKWVRPEEVARLIVYLCSEEGRSINGSCIPLFGGV